MKLRNLLVNEPWSTESEVVERYCTEAVKLGATAVIVNRLPDDFHPGLLEDPTNLYPKFFHWGPSLDMFFSVDLNRHVWPEELLSRNRKALLRTCAVARRHGLKLVVVLGEPRYQPERFFQKNPHLRGPRVDNPNTSPVPYFAPCVQAPEMKDYYREMMTKLLKAIPDLQGMIFYNGDSGTGICHSERLYAGPNGPRFCESVSPSQKLLDFMNLLLEAAQSVNPEFRIWMYHYIAGKEREYVLENSGPDISYVAVGNFVAGGSLEDSFATLRYGADIDKVGYERPFKERLQMMRDDMERVDRMGKAKLQECTLPVEQWLMPMRTVPYPFQIVRILEALEDIGADDMFFYGSLTDPSVVPYDVNRSIIQHRVRNPRQSPDAAVRALATEWVHAEAAEKLVDAWRLCDRAYRQRPLWCWSFGYQSNFFPGPLVPNPPGLNEKERSYYYSPGEANRDRIPGSDFRNSLRYEEEYRDWMLARYETHAINFTEEAAQTLREALDTSHDEKVRVCLESQMRQVCVFEWWLRSQRNWLEAGRFLAPGEGKPGSERDMKTIIGDEIDNTKSLMTTIDGHVEELFTGSWNPIYMFDDSLMDALEKRVLVMKAHQSDGINPCEPPG